jgi:DNA modification methylase
MDVAKLMGNDAADLVFADPPYNIDYEGYTELRLRSKAIGCLSGFQALSGICISLLPQCRQTWCLSPCVPFLVEDGRKRHHANHGDGSQKFRDAIANMKRRLDKLERLMAPKFKEDFRVSSAASWVLQFFHLHMKRTARREAVAQAAARLQQATGNDR